MKTPRSTGHPVYGTLLPLALVFWLALVSPAAAQIKVDPDLPEYKPVSGVSGNLNSVGSDTLNNMMTLWSETFRKIYPNVNIQVEGKGSSTAPPALVEGTAQLGPMSRAMKNSEIERFESRFGFKPTRFGVALDSLAIFVHKDNPLESLSLPQVDAIFSKNRRGGMPRDIFTWGQLGLTAPWANRSISLYGRNSASGTYGYFKEVGLFKGDFKDRVKEQPGSASVVQGVESDLGAIGYSGIGYKTSGVRVVPISKKNGGKAYPPEYAHVLKGKYPLSRALFIYIVQTPGKPLDKITAEFLRFVLSRQGQEVVVKDGYLPLPAKMALKQLKNLP
ncbi:MAG: phosphate ABC transporter substrate-binding protein [Deltaproteobacteria bacterium]|nr:phosphate ABC transporter substrate-binding protein [Deltaproteobacteria bacterium]